MDLILLFMLFGTPSLEVGPIPGGPAACAALEAQITAEIAAAGAGDTVRLGDEMVAISELSVRCAPPPAESCPVPDEIPDLLT